MADYEYRTLATDYMRAHAGQVPGVVLARLGRTFGIYRPGQQLSFETDRHPDRLREAKDMIARLDAAFTHYADSLVDADLGTLDIDLKLLRKSLDDDLGPFASAVREDRRKP